METDHLDSSPFHSGEKLLQNKYGVRESMENFGRQVIRDYLPQQHQEFYQQLPYIFVGFTDDNGWLWASILYGNPGFIESSEPTTLEIKSVPVKGDPLTKNADSGKLLGLLGVDLQSKRRNRVSGLINQVTKTGFSIDVIQAFGNCPRYIHQRSLKPIDEKRSSRKFQHKKIYDLDTIARDLIRHADTVFVASAYEKSIGPANEGADISHRGGEPGFIEIMKHNKLKIPEYSGNFHFNTLGNFLKNPKAGLLFIDFDNGHMLTLTGNVELHIGDESDSVAERYWIFDLYHGEWIENALPIIWQLEAD